ncbi:MAG: hypothetical protein HPY76_10105 [Anaerolineae bacterium]|nr:hypothetical protein [Anaerolineae bacterium]
MNDLKITPQFETALRQSYGVPPIRTEFVDRLYGDLLQRAQAKPHRPRPALRLRPAGAIALAILAFFLVITLVIGPQRVYAAMLQFFGYIPGVGIVDQSSPIRMLAEPVSVTRDGITVSVNQAVLTGVDTRIDFGISGVPLSAYPKGEAVTGCMDYHYLRLPDGSKAAVTAPIPTNIDEATLVIPCIFNTLPGAVPTDWELPLRFIAAPPELTVLPVIDVTPYVTLAPTVSPPGVGMATPIAPTQAPPQASVTVEKVIETADGYILLGFVRPHIPEGSWLQVTGAAVIRDADGNKVSYAFPSDVQPLDDPNMNQGGSSWVMQIKGTGVKFPLTIGFSGVVISQVDPQASARITVDVGANPVAGQVWEVNQDFQLAGYPVRLLSITADSRNGYSFRVDPGVDLSGMSVQIEGYQAVGGGGGGWQGVFSTSLAYSELPTGRLKLLFTNPLSASPTEEWQVMWQPGAAREFTPAAADADLCWDANTIATVPTLPAGLDGSVVITQMNPQLQIVLAGMDGSQQRIIAPGSARAALSWDASRLAYVTTEGIAFVDLFSGASSLITGAFGHDPHWSPDGRSIAVVNYGDLYGIFVVGSDSNAPQQLSNLGYESIAGWSPDGSTLFYAIPGSGGDGFLLRAVNVAGGDTRDLFVLENSSRKAPLPAVSPDGRWIAYRASDNASLYIKGMDGSSARLVLDSPATAINGIAWEKESHLLGVSLITPEHPDGEIFLIAPDSCETYRLPGLSGELDGVIIP